MDADALSMAGCYSLSGRVTGLDSFIALADVFRLDSLRKSYPLDA